MTTIASTMSSRNLTYDTMLNLLKQHGFEAVSADSKPKKHSVQTVSITSMIGLACLDEHTQCLIYILSFLNPEGIPQKILIDHSSRAQPKAYPTNHAELNNAQTKPQLASLISFNESTHSLRMHRIYQDIVRESLSPEMRMKALVTALGIISQAWIYQPLEHRFNTTRYEACSAIFPHVGRIYQHYEEMFKTRNVNASEQAACLFNDAGWYWFERGFPQESKPFCRLAQSICETLNYTKPSEKVAKMLRESHNNQGSAANETNDPQESLQHNLMWLSLMRERVSPDGKGVVDYELGCVYNEVGVAYAMNSMYSLALDFFQQSISTYQSLPDYDEKWLGWPLPNIGMVHWIQGNHQAALEALHRMREIFETAYAPDDTESFKTGKVLYGIGNVYLSLGNLDRALDCHLRCFNQWSITLGELHHRIGDVGHKIAQDFMGQGQFDKAQDYLSRALRIFARRPFHKHKHARTIFRQGQLYLARGKPELAEQSFKAAHKQRQSLKPQDTRPWDELLEKDYDELVIFMSR
ncbi:NB-ARC and TPR domain protein, partial [Metarhizium brunneum ARSEF 3297]